MFIWILIISLVFCNFENFFVVNDFEVAECINQHFCKLLLDDLFPVVQVLVLEVVDQLYFAVLAIFPQYTHDVLVESLNCGSVFGAS